MTCPDAIQIASGRMIAPEHQMLPVVNRIARDVIPERVRTPPEDRTPFDQRNVEALGRELGSSAQTAEAAANDEDVMHEAGKESTSGGKLRPDKAVDIAG